MLAVLVNILFVVISAFPDYKFKLPYNTSIQEWKFLNKEPSIRLSDVIATELNDTYDIIYDLMKRVLGGNELLNKFTLELIESDINDIDIDKLPIFVPKHNNHPFWSKVSSKPLDIIELDNDGTNIILRGSSTIGLAVAFNWYLQSYCNTSYDWRTYSLDMPNILPLPNYQKKIRSVPFMYYQNVCTVSYSFAFWDWYHWERHIDWMVLQGINIPLAFTGQEYIWSKTFMQFGLNTTDLSTFFAGPGFYAWQRMGNIQGWGGPLRESEIIGQYNLQLKILARMNTFEMNPVLTCFAGHVPSQMSILYPNANITKSPDWGGFNKEYCCVSLLDASDPLFAQIGSKFIELQTKYYGTSHIYNCDTFNEMTPASNDPSYLQSYSSDVYNAMEISDENAIWLMQGWLFLNKFWNNITVKAYLSGVADDAMIILDLYSDSRPIYLDYDSYYGKPFFWCTLHDFGGHDGIQGNLPNIMNGFVKGLNFPNTTIMGVGTTMEGIWQNYIVYDFTYFMGYQTEIFNLSKYVQEYGYRRYGLPHSVNATENEINIITMNLVNSWIDLGNTLYKLGDGPQTNLATEFPNFGFGKVNHDPMIVQKIWKQFVNVGDALKNVEKFRYDLVDITRQIFSDLFYLNYANFSTAYNEKDITNATKYGEILIDIMTDLDSILLTNKHWMLSTWIEMARNQTNDTSNNNDTKNWYEFNARNQITLWGPTGQINNYACKQWGDVIGTYYLPQWQLFINQVIECMKNGTKWNENQFYESNYPKYELPWQTQTGGYHIDVVGDTIQIACNLYKKWNLNGDQTCN